MACNARCALIILCVIQIIVTAEKEVFDFLCVLWTPVLLNVLHIVMTVIVLVGICRYIYRILVIYSVWCLVWTAWNIFVVCFYYEVGVLSKDLPVMNLGCNGLNWLPKGFLGCSKATLFVEEVYNSTSDPGNFTSDSFLQYDDESTGHPSTRPFGGDVLTDETALLSGPRSSTAPTVPGEDEEGGTSVSTLLDSTGFDMSTTEDVGFSTDSFSPELQELLSGEDAPSPLLSVSYRTLQVIHAALQCFLAVCCFILTCTLAHIYSEEEDSSCLEFDFISGSLLPQNEKTPAQKYHLKALYV